MKKYHSLVPRSGTGIQGRGGRAAFLPVIFRKKKLRNADFEMPLFTDTDPNIEAMMISGYRKMEPWKKLALSEAMTQTVMQLAAARIRKQHEGISERELLMRLGSLWLDRETMVKAFGWDPDIEGY
jgi:hypothetical protein